MNNEDELIVLKNSIGSRLLLVALVLPIIAGGCFLIATEITTRPFASILVGVAQLGFLVVALASGWSTTSYNSETVSSHIPLAYRGSVAWSNVTTYRIGWMTHTLLRDGRPVLKIPAMRPRPQPLWDECERRGIQRET